jgi:acetate kinase
MAILTLNCGSSSVKYQVYDWDKRQVLSSGIVERVTLNGSFIKHGVKGREDYKHEKECPSHKEAIALILETLVDPAHGALSSISAIKAVGHRVVHGGEKFSRSVLIDANVLSTFEEIQGLAPLHNPANIMGIRAAQAVLPRVPHCAVIDTAWHQTMPQSSFLYALPYEWYSKHGVRRYGFHGTSFLYTAKRAAVLLGKDPFKTNLVIAHIGNGSSINAVKDGCSFDTSMGLTPLEGLVMGTRAGDHDPAISFFIMRKTGMSPDEVENALNKKSGVYGITEKWVDRRDIEQAAEAGNQRAQLAIDMEAYRIRKYIGAYAAAVGGIDAVVFTAGVGERGPIIREGATRGLEFMGVRIDQAKNRSSMTRNGETCISTDDSKVKVFVIPTDEELVMTQDTMALVGGSYDVHTAYRYIFQEKNYQNAEREESLKKDLAKWKGLDAIIARP